MIAGDQIGVTGLGARSRQRLLAGAVWLGLSIYAIAVLGSGSGHAPVFSWSIRAAFGLLGVLAVELLLQGARARRPLQLRDGILRVADGVRIRQIPLAEVTGVGLLFRWATGRSGLAAGWYLAIWNGDGTMRTIEECSVQSHWTQRQYLGAAQPQENSEELATSPAGLMALRIYDAAWAVQGSSGPLATRQEQKMRTATVWTRDINTYGFWSPDGEMQVFGPQAHVDWDDD